MDLEDDHQQEQTDLNRNHQGVNVIMNESSDEEVKTSEFPNSKTWPTQGLDKQGESTLTI